MSEVTAETGISTSTAAAWIERVEASSATAVKRREKAMMAEKGL
jgi:hypothetical protein